MKTIDYPRIVLGKQDGKNIYLSPPLWSCGWYWSFGYLGNKDCHYHLHSIGSKNMCNNLKEHFGESLKINNDDILYVFCEIATTIYALKETAEVLGRGGSHYTTNPCAEVIKNREEVNRINEIVIPALFVELYKVLTSKSSKNLER